MYVQHGVEFVGRFIELPEALVAEGDTVDVAEDHGATKFELLHGAAQFDDGGRWIVERKRGQSGKPSLLVGDDAGKDVIHQTCQSHGRSRVFDMRAGSGQSDELRIDAGGAQDLFAVVD